MSAMATDQLPTGWVKTTLGAIRLDLSVGVDPAMAPDTVFELYSVPSHQCGKPEILTGKLIGSSKRSVRPGTVLLCKINPRINRVWVAGNHSPHAKIASTEWIQFLPVLGIDPRYLAYFLRQNNIRDFLAASASGVGGSLMRVRALTLRDLEFRLAPSTEQIRIADLLDELFSRLDAGVMALGRAQTRLERYRESVLKAAVEGTLTSDWRGPHPNLELGSELLKRILTDRRRCWEADQLRKFGKKPKPPPKNWKAGYKEPAVPDIADLPSLPDGWCWATLAQLAWASGYGTSVKCTEEDHGLPVLRIPNIVDGRVSLDGLKYAPREYVEHDYNLVSEGDLLVVRTNGSRSLIGRGAVIRGNQERPLSFASYLIRLRLVKDRTLLSWVALLWDSPYVRNWVEIHAATSAGQYNISLRVLNTLVVPIPPRKEQESIVEIVEDQLSTIDHLEADLTAKLKAAQSLKQAILRQAFSGRLVPQDPNEEPASELLKRIATERKAQSRRTAATTLAAKNTNSKKPGRRGRPQKAAVAGAR